MGFCLKEESVRLMESGACEEESLRALFRACDVDSSGVIERWEFERMCSEMRVRSEDIDDIFTKLDVNEDGAINMSEFIRGFQAVSGLAREGGMVNGAEAFPLAWEDFRSRLGEHTEFIPRIDQVSTLYQNISLTEPRMIPQYENVLRNFTSEIKLQSKEMERLALAVKRAQDQAAMQLSAMEEEMDQRIHTTERNTRMEESKKAEATLRIVKEQFDGQLSELRQKILTLQMFEDQSKNSGVKEENVALKRKNNELTLQNQKLKQELLETHTSIAFLQSELDSVKSDLTDHSINLERDEALMRSFSEERDNLERQIEILHLANRKLHDSNDGLRMTVENSQSKKNQRRSGLSPSSTINRTKGMCTPYFERCCKVYRDDDFEQLRLSECLQTSSRESLALALCDPMRRQSSCEVDSLDESCVDSGMSTLRSNNGYDSEQESTGQSVARMAAFSCSGDTSDTEVLDVQDEEACESDSESILKMTSNSADLKDITASGKKCLSAIFDEKLKYETAVMAQGSEKTYKIVLAGDAAVGKSSFLLRLCKNEFKGITSTTLGVDFHIKTLVVDGMPTVLQLWDTAGQERFKSIAKSYFRRADGVLLLYDVTCEKSFLNVREWVDTIEDVSQDKIPIMLVGNKTDLRQQALQDGITCISTGYGEKLARTYSSLFCETSAKDGSNIIEAVLHLAREVIKHAHERKRATLGQILTGSPNTKLTSSKCCRTS